MTVITNNLNMPVLGLTPLQRLDAIRNYDGHAVNSQWFTAVGLVIVVLLLTLLLVRVYHRHKNTQKTSGQRFDEHAKTKNLTDREYRLLMSMATNAELVRTEFIFTLPSAFDRESARLIEQVRAEQGVEQSHQLEAEITILREKLGFHRYTSPEVNLTSDTKIQSTRQIASNKRFYIKRRLESNASLEATVVKNTPAGLFVQFHSPVEIVFGQTWICRYYAGAYIAEFHTTVAKCSGQIVVLNHSNHVRLINRRRFLRVPINSAAYVAEFPFNRVLQPYEHTSRKKRMQDDPRSLTKENEFELPQFVPATVTELGGPGLRISTELRLNVGDRILIIFKVASKAGGDKYIEHIAKVRHIVNEEEPPSVALEMIGMSNDSMDELIRVTNEVSLEMNKWRHSMPNADVRNIWAEEVLSV